MKYTITDALKTTGKSFYIKNNDYNEIKWGDKSEIPTLKWCEDKRDEMQKDWDSKEYQRDRASAFPSWQDQMDLLYHGGLDALKAELKKTKDAYPKP